MGIYKTFSNMLRRPKSALDFWNKNAGKHIEDFSNWEANNIIAQHQNYRVSGDRNIVALAWFYKKYGRPFMNAASAGSGTGILEQHLCSMNFTGPITGFDISPKSIEIAKKNCSQYANVKFEVADLNKKVWPKECFDVIFAHGSLHHIKAFEWCVGQMKEALKQDGILYLNDYVGPQRFQWTDLQLDLANKLLKEVPRKWVKNPVVSRCDPNELKRIDPSEAVNSHLTEAAIKANFSIIETKRRGGTLLAPIFGGGCLRPCILDTPEGEECLNKMAIREAELIDSGVIPANYVVIVAKKEIGGER